MAVDDDDARNAKPAYGRDGAPTEEDARFDDFEYNPQLEPTKSYAWLNLLRESEKAFEKWNDHCDLIEKQYANMERLASMARDKEFQMFWANCEVIKPSILARPPVPVVVPKFKDRNPVYQAAAETLERCAVVAFDLAHIEELMKQLRDDVAMIGRGVAWCRYESGNEKGSYYDGEKVCVDFKHRKDFLHSVSRNWAEVTWVAAASYLTREEARARFEQFSGDAYQDAEYKVDRDSNEVGGVDKRERAKFWEVWDKTNRRVVWVAEGVEVLLDEDDPHLELCDFFPCPKPAYGTLQRGSLVPVPDIMQYKDQLEELNLLTSKIHALSDALEAKGFYPAGGAEIADAVQAAIATRTPGRMLVPISNWAAFGGSKEVIVWLPIAEIAQTITALQALRQQIIQDIYQIMGLSDIMRGSTDARETLGAQELKSQYGSTRIKDKQEELVRVARDLVRITCDIITDKFDKVTIIEMSQTQLPTQAMQKQQAQQLQTQLAQQQAALAALPQTPQYQQLQQANPQQVAQLQQQGAQLLQEGQKALEKIGREPTFEQVMHLFKNVRTKSFVLDIETDSTIMVDENTEKQRRAEFTGVLAQLLPQLAQMIAAEPQTATFCGEVLKFATAPYRAGRALDGAIDDLVAQMEAKANQPKGNDPATLQATTAKEIEQMKVDRAKERDKQDAAIEMAKLKQADDHKKLDLASRERIEREKIAAASIPDQTRIREQNQKAMFNREKHQADMIKMDAGVRADQMKADTQMRLAMQKRADMAQRAQDQRAAQQFKMMQPQRPPL